MRKVLMASLAGLVLSVGAAHADGDPAKGEKVFNRCKACHMIGENAKPRVGPPLNGIVGREFGAYEGFNYSKSLQDLAEQGKVWDEDTLDAYLENPKKIIPRGRMAFPGLKNEDQREDVIAYLKQFAADGTKTGAQ